LIGSKLGPYEITAKLGEGGMGEVYRATDTKLKRQVAIKVLPQAFVADAERLARFEREAQLLAQLHHPNIASIFGLEESGGVRALVMELVEGPTLAERLEGGPLPLDESLSLARQIAEALEEAHEKGIIHRDLKPQNIKASAEGKVKILDFGLAKALSRESGITSASALANSPTLTAGATVEGMILGTAAYMSPEQAKGKAVDKRADIWAFGVVLYEMLLGRKLFEAETLAETLGAIFRQEIDLDELPASTPRRLRQLLERCLERDPKKRLRDIGEARIALDAVAAGEDEPLSTAVVEPVRRGISVPFVAALALGAAAISGLLVWRVAGTPADEFPVAPRITEFSVEVDQLGGMELSPDGRRLLWIDGQRGAPERSLWVRDLDNRSPRKIVSDPGLGFPIWSPDSNALAVTIGEKLWRYPVAGGEPTPICDFPRLPNVPGAFPISGAWLRDDTIVFGAWRGGAYRVPARGGAPELYVPIDPAVDVDFHYIFPLPGETGLILGVHRQEGADRSSQRAAWRTDLFADGKRTPLDLGGELADDRPFGFAQGVLLLAQYRDEDISIRGVPFDPARRAVTGKPFVILPRVAEVSASADGTFAWSPRREVPGVVQRVDETGAAVATLGTQQVDLGYPELSPDGARLAMVLGGKELWVDDLRRGTTSRLVRVEGQIREPEWTPDGRTLYYAVDSANGALQRIRADPGASAETVLEGLFVASLAPDASGFLFNKADFRLERGQGLFWSALDAAGKAGEPKQLVGGIGTFGRLSPNGKMLAYGRAEGRRQDAFLTTFPELDQTIQLSSNFAETPRWSADGRAVYYLSGGRLVRVDVGFDGSGRLTASPEKKLFDVTERGLDPDGWSVAPDGTLLFVKPMASDERSEIVVTRDGLQRALAENGTTPR